MAYIVPIHRPSSVRHALRLNLLDADEECLVLAKANRLEIWVQTPDGLSMAHSKAIYGRITMLQKIRPANAVTDHLFIGTDRFQYFTLVWDPSIRQLDTVHKFVDVSEKHMRDSQSLDRCLVDPTGKYIVMELFEGVLNLVKIMKPRKGAPDYLSVPEQVRITELFVRSSSFLYAESKSPKLALLYQDGQDNIRLATYRLTDDKGQYSHFDAKKDREDSIGDLDPGASALIPVPKGEEEQKRYIYRNLASAKAQLGGVIIVGETRMKYFDDESKAIVDHALDEASIFVAWERYDNLRYLLGDDYGRLYLLKLLVEGAVVTGMEVKLIGNTSKASSLVYLGNDILYVASHEGDSQVIKLDLVKFYCEVVQVMPNIAPILDFTVMDMGSRSGEGQTNEYSSGQARIVTGSGAYQTGSLRSVRSGVGLEDLGILGEMEDIRALFPLRSHGSKMIDTLVVSFLTETRVFRFDSQGDVEEVAEFFGLSLSEQTLVVSNVANGQLIQITASKVVLSDSESGRVVASWQPPNGQTITAASANDTYVLVSADGKSLVSLDLRAKLSEIAQRDLSDSDQVACVYVPGSAASIGLVGFWQSGSVEILNLQNLENIQGETVRTADSAAVPRSIVLAQILPPAVSGPTLLVAMSDGVVLTFVVDKNTYALSGKKSVVLGVQQASLKVLERPDGLFNVFATCEHSSLIYGAEGRIVYSAVTAENATCVCSFDSEAFPDAIVVATAEDIRISQIDQERRTHVRTLPVGETVRRIAYSANEKAFGIGSVKRELITGEEIISSTFRLVDEVMFGELGKPFILDTSNGTELIETVIRAELPNTYGEPVERFIVGTSYLTDRPDEPSKGRIMVFSVNQDRSPHKICEIRLKGACRCVAVLDGKIVAALVKTVVMFHYDETSSISASLNKIATYRTSTCPIDLSVTGNIIAVADLMKSISLVEYIPGVDGENGELKEVARHFQSSWATAVSHIEGNSYLESDAVGNLMVLRRNIDGVTLEDRQRLEVTSEMRLGEMVNRIRKINVDTTANATVIPRAFLATTEGSIYLFATIVQSAQDLLMRLQTRMAELVQSPGQIPFNIYRGFKNIERETEEPFRFVDGEMVERFLDVSEIMQEDICKGLGPSVEDVRNLVEELKRLH